MSAADRSVRVTIPPNLDAEDDLHFFGGTVQIDDAQSEAVLVAAGLLEKSVPRHSGVVFRCMVNIEAKPIRWLWPNRIARGKVSIIAGHPGLGKSQVTASMAAIVTNGGRWPVDRTGCERGKVIFLSAEDDPADTIRPRLEAAGADLGRVFVLDAVSEVSGDDITTRTFNLTKDIPRLGALLAEIGDVALVVIDPVSAYLGSADSHNNAEIRGLLAPLAKLAEEYGTAIVCVSHLNKGGGAGSDALLRVTGSLAFVAAARAAYIVAKDNSDPHRRLFLPIKNNVGNDQGGLAFAIESQTIGGGIETSSVSWEADPVTLTADEALTPEANDDGRTEREAATSWLRDMLANGPMPASEIKKHSTEAGLAWATVRRAKDALGIKPAKTRFDGGWEWALPSKVLTSHEDAHSRSVSILGSGEHLGGENPPTWEGEL